LTNFEVSNVAKRALDIIANSIADFKSGRITFFSLVNGSEVAINSMIGQVDQEWLEEWRLRWNSLEMINASLIDESRRELTEDELRVVNDTIDMMVGMTIRY
jgi:hypothetical protein